MTTLEIEKKDWEDPRIIGRLLNAAIIKRCVKPAKGVKFIGQKFRLVNRHLANRAWLTRLDKVARQHQL